MCIIYTDEQLYYFGGKLMFLNLFLNNFYFTATAVISVVQ